MSASVVLKNQRTFLVVWLGQFISIIGSGLTGFALGVIVFQDTGNATDFILITAFQVIPTIILSPIAGSYIDRFNRRTIMLIADIVAGISTIIIVGFVLSGQLTLWHIYLVTAINASANTFQFPAFSALTAQIVDAKSLGRANGLVSLGESISGISAPIIAGVLVAMAGIEAVLLIDLLTFIFAVMTLLMIRVPDVAPVDSEKDKKRNIWDDMKISWRFIRDRRSLVALLLFAMILNIIAIPELLVTPLVLSFADENALGIVLGLGGLGFFLGSLLMSIWGCPKRLGLYAIGLELVAGLTTICMGLQTSATLIAIALFIQSFTFPITGASLLTIWQRKVPNHLLGRVLSTRRLLSWLALPVSLVLAGPLVDTVLEPFMQSDAYWAGQFGNIIGTGTGRGIALMMLFSGTLNMVLAIVGLLYQPLREIETVLPDEN